jgi:integrase
MTSITKEANDRWRARYRDPSGVQVSRRFDRKVDAEQWLDRVTASVIEGTYVDPRAGRVRFRAYALGEYAERQVWVPKTYDGLRLAVESTNFAEVELRRIRPSHVAQWVKRMQAGDETSGRRALAPSTIATRYNHVRAVFRAAVRDRMIPSDPSENLRLPRQRKREAAMVIPTGEQIGGLVQAGGERFGVFVALCAFAGLRLGEAAGVQVGDIDFLRRTLHVRRQVQLVNRDRVDVRAPKYGSERNVALPDELCSMLSRHVARLGDGAVWLFTRSGGGPVHQNTITYLWRKTRRDAGVSGVRLHDTRHYYASGLIAAGCDVVTVSRALGRSSSTTTLGTYAHLWPSAEDRTRKAAAGLIVESLDPGASTLRPAER